MRARVPSVSDTRPAARAATPPTLTGSLVGLHRSVGNRAMGRLARRVMQRKVGWSDASQAGYAWNAGERQVGAIRRIPLEELPVGLPTDAPIGGLTTESAVRRAIVLLPKALDATQPVEYVIFLHGHTEDSSTRPFAGWRAYTGPKPAKGKKETGTQKLRHGIDATDVAPVRDVALDQAEKQLEDSGQTQTVILLPQGALTSQFGDAGDKNFDSGNYVSKVAARLLTERCWLDAKGDPVTDKSPTPSRITMAGHSGAGATLANMANETAPSAPLTGDLVIFDAINGRRQLKAFQDWARKRLDEDLTVLTGPKSEAEKLKYLHDAPKLRGFFTDLYKDQYAALETTIRAWFKAHSTELGAFARCLRQNFMLTHVNVQHEELMRASLRTALLDLHRPLAQSTADCPKMPEELEEDARERSRRRKAPHAKVKAAAG